MGCDIHLCCEHYNEESKRWEALSLYKKKDDGGFEPVDVYDGRDYELFGLLAGVRGSSHMFSGGYGYIVEPRGLPNDMSVAAQKAWEDGADADGHNYWHTPTWYDFNELETYSYLLNDFNKALKQKSNRIEELEKEVKKLKNEDEEDEILWLDDEYDDKRSVFERLASLVGDVSDLLWKYGIYNPKPGEVRLVMWFDS